VRHFENKLGIKFQTIFGLTECSPAVSMTTAKDSPEDKATTIGTAMPNVEVKVIHPESGEVLPIGEVGEYCVRGYNVMHGYFDMPEASAETIDQDGWLRTGDLCSMDQRGYCTVEGRLKDMIIRGGENVYPREIEDCLFEHPSVAEAAVVGVPDDRMGEVVAAFIRVAPAATTDRDELFAYLRERLSPQKTPAHWIFVDSYPLTGSGKIQKFELRKQWVAGDFS
jgi:fatty-acyl-CoA synthase